MHSPATTKPGPVGRSDAPASRAPSSSDGAATTMRTAPTTRGTAAEVAPTSASVVPVVPQDTAAAAMKKSPHTIPDHHRVQFCIGRRLDRGVNTDSKG
jgi:hypothetical protein